MWLFVILLLAAVLRFVFLDKIPTTITGDELSYIISGKAFVMTGFDPSGTVAFWQPLIFKYPVFNLPQAELNYFLLMPFVQGDFSLFLVRLPFAFLGVALVVAVYLVTKELLNKKVALVAAFFAAISPWFIAMSRTGYEVTPAMTFYLFGLFVLLKTKGWKIFFALPLFLLAFYSYIATKLIFLPFIVGILSYLYFVKNKRKFGKQYALFGLVSVVFVGLFMVLLTVNNGQRLSDILLPNSPVIAKEVNAFRAVSIHTPVMNLFVNKISVYGQTLINNFLTTISVPYLFLSGDNFFGIWRHGLFYVLDAFFLLFGAVHLFRKERFLFFFLGGAILLGLVPQIIHKGGMLFTPHITFIFPFVLIIVAYGAVSVSEFFKQRKGILLVSVIGVYVVLAANFLNIYFTNYPIQGESDLQVRVLSRYITLAKEQGKRVVVYSSRSNDLLRKHVFYASLYSPQTIELFRRELAKNDPGIDNVVFRSCDDNQNPNIAKETTAKMSDCAEKFPSDSSLLISRLSDGGGVFTIYKDEVCRAYGLQRYPSGFTVTSLAVEKLSKEQFCKTYITTSR